MIHRETQPDGTASCVDEFKNTKHIRLLYSSYLSKKDEASWEDGAGGVGARGKVLWGDKEIRRIKEEILKPGKVLEVLEGVGGGEKEEEEQRNPPSNNPS